jgi:hypothetical protein
MTHIKNWRMFLESYSSSYYSLTDKYIELGDDLYAMTDTFDEWLLNTEDDIKLLAIIALMMDANLVEYFQLDDTFFEALEMNYEYSGYEFDREYVKILINNLVEKGYLEKKV